MILNNFSENPRKSLQISKNNLQHHASNQIPQFIIQINSNLSKKSQTTLTKTQTFPNKIVSDFRILISQKLEKYWGSSLEVLAITLMKVMTHQLMENGYSSLKLNILKTIHEIEKEMIFHKFFILFNFKTSPSELSTILKNSVKLIKNALQNEKLSEKYLNSTKNQASQQKDCLKIHRLVMNHVKQFPICLQFFGILVKMILMLVKYPKIDSSIQDLPPKEIYYIVCDYLNCRIQQNTQGYFFEKVHFIRQAHYHFQFGLTIGPLIKSSLAQLFFSVENKLESRQTNDLFFCPQKQISPLNVSIQIQKKQKSAEKQFLPKMKLKNSLMFLKIDKKIMQKCESTFEVRGKHSSENQKENHEINNLNTTNGSQKLTTIRNTNKSVYIDTQIKHLRGQRKSENLKRVRNKYETEFKCFKCSMKRKLSLTSNVFRIQI